MNGRHFRGAPLSFADARVDMWLRDTLASRFDTVLDEKIPDDWLRMIGGREPGQQ